MPQTQASTPPGTMGNPGMRPDGTIAGLSSPVPAPPATAALAKPYGYDERVEALWRRFDRLPEVVSARDQARAAGAK
jgi:hypothetical protein